MKKRFLVSFGFCLLLAVGVAGRVNAQAKTTVAKTTSTATTKTTTTTATSTAAKKTNAVATNTSTAKSTKTSVKTKKQTGHWKKKRNYYFYIRNKKRLKGFKQIAGDYYLFDSKGRQMTGWRLVNGNYRYFRIKNGRKGKMLTSTKINGVKINSKGIAVVKDSVRKKLELLVRFQELADSLVKPGMKKKEKLVIVFKYARDKNYRSIGSPSSDGHWDERLAEAFLNNNWADCTMAACGFAYLANAVGYKNVAVRLYGHGHCEINQLIYDPGFAKTMSDDGYTKYYARTYQELPAWGTGSSIPIRFI